MFDSATSINSVGFHDTLATLLILFIPDLKDLLYIDQRACKVKKNCAINLDQRFKSDITEHVRGLIFQSANEAIN